MSNQVDSEFTTPDLKPYAKPVVERIPLSEAQAGQGTINQNDGETESS